MYNPQLETFIAVAKSGSFSKAAERLYITPTAVMKQINALEKRIGIKLTTRTNHGLRLTEAGKSFLQDAKYVVDYSKRAIEKAKEIESKNKIKSVRLGTSMMTPVRFLAEIRTEIQAVEPNLKIELVPFENTSENMYEILKNWRKHIDVIAGIYDEGWLSEHSFQVQHLYDKTISVAVPLSHELSDRQQIAVEDLKGRKIMLIKKGWNRIIDEFRQSLLLLDVSIVDFEYFGVAAFNRAAVDNLPIIIADGWENVHPLLRVLPIQSQLRIPFGLLYSKTPSASVKKFVNLVKKIIE